MHETGQRRDSAIGRVLEVLEEHKNLLQGLRAEEDSSFNRKAKLHAVGEGDEDAAPSPDGASSGSGSPGARPAKMGFGSKVRFDSQYEIPELISGHEPEKPEMMASRMVDPEIHLLLQSDRQLQQLLQKIKTARMTSEWKQGRGSGNLYALSPDSRFRSVWNIILATLLVFTCCLVPLRIAFPQLFEDDADAWLAADIFVEWYFFVGVILNFFTGYRNRDGVLILNLNKIAEKYLKGWFMLDMLSSIPFDTISVAVGPDAISTVLRLNKVLRVARLFKVVGLLRQNKMIRRYVGTSTMKLVELTLFLILAWHYFGCFWWAIGDAFQRSKLERLRVIDQSAAFDEDAAEQADFGLQYLAAFYWAVLMTTGLSVTITPGMRSGLIIYECGVAFFGVCLQAYMLGAAASEIANMDAQDTQRRQRLKEIKQHLRSLRVPMFLREPITEYYERETAVNESVDAASAGQGPLRDLPSSLKVQLAVTLNQDFLRKSAFFGMLDGTVSAALILCMRSRVCLPDETLIHQGDISYALYFIRSGSVQVMKLEGPMGLEAPTGQDPLGISVATLNEGACFGEQSFISAKPSLASVRTLGYTTIYQIFKTDFEKVQSMFPQLRMHVAAIQREKAREYKEDEISRSGRKRRNRNYSMWTNLRSSKGVLRRISTMPNMRSGRISTMPTSRSPNGHGTGSASPTDRVAPKLNLTSSSTCPPGDLTVTSP